MLTLKLTTLPALTAAFRVSEITNLDINFFAKHPACYRFAFSKVSKSWKKGQSAPVIKCLVCDLDESLCVCKTIDQHLKRTEVCRSDHGQLFLGLIKPH